MIFDHTFARRLSNFLLLALILSAWPILAMVL